jgi:hypothetical protein
VGEGVVAVVIALINIVLVLVAVSLAVISKSTDTNAIRVFLLDYFIKEIVLVYLAIILLITLRNWAGSAFRLISVISTVITIGLLLFVFKFLSPY